MNEDVMKKFDDMRFFWYLVDKGRYPAGAVHR